MKKILLLGLLLGLPSPLFASDSTDGYKKMDSCINNEKHYLAKKENSNSKKWGTYACDYDTVFGITTNCQWFSKAVSYDEANSDYEGLCGLE